jgi:hypothetical protein
MLAAGADLFKLGAPSPSLTSMGWLQSFTMIELVLPALIVLIAALTCGTLRQCVRACGRAWLPPRSCTRLGLPACPPENPPLAGWLPALRCLIH